MRLIVLAQIAHSRRRLSPKCFGPAMSESLVLCADRADIASMETCRRLVDSVWCIICCSVEGIDCCPAGIKREYAP